MHDITYPTYCNELQEKYLNSYHFASSAITVGINDIASSFAPGITSANGLILQFGPDAYNGGIDNVSFTANLLQGTAVPEPASLALFGSALFAVALMRRRREAR